MSTKTQTAEREEYIARLREIVKPGDTIFTTLRHVSRSGMQRKIGVWLFTCENGNIAKHWLSWRVAKAIGERFDERTETVVVSGCGMDMGFHIVYNLGRVLFPDGFPEVMYMKGGDGHTVELRGESKEDAATLYAKGWRARGRNGDDSGWDNDGGYALRHEWL